MALTVWFVTGGPAFADTGNTLLEHCLAQDRVSNLVEAYKDGNCYGYLSGVTDSLQAAFITSV